MANQDWRDEIFGECGQLVQIQVCQRLFEVPIDNNLLRCFQYLRTEVISLGDYCWNGDCSNCLLDYQQPNGEIKTAMACRMEVKPGLNITKLSNHLHDDLFGD